MRVFDPAGFNPNGPAVRTLSTSLGYGRRRRAYGPASAVQQQIAANWRSTPISSAPSVIDRQSGAI
jgi:hypothetical protein